MISGMYASWVTTVENTIRAHHGCEANQGALRAQVPTFELQQVRVSNRCRSTPLRDQAAGWWTRLHTILDSLHKHRSRNNGVSQRARLERECRRLLEDRPDQ
eukprot:8682910-Pyramimonas_sp.AAC.1